MSQDYAVRSKEEAVAYLDHPVLGKRLQECCNALLDHRGKDISDIMGFPDDLKLRSSMTLFAGVSPKASIYHHILDIFFNGEEDEKNGQFSRFLTVVFART